MGVGTPIPGRVLDVSAECRSCRMPGQPGLILKIQGRHRSLVQDLYSHTPLPIKAIPTTKNNKKLRADLVTPLIESGRVFLPKRARWRDDFLYEMTVFPSSLNSGQVDVLSQALTFLKSRFDKEETHRHHVVRGSTERRRIYEPEESDEPDRVESDYLI